MPHIRQERRKELAPLVDPIVGIADTLSKGDINYLITRIVAAKYAPPGGSYETKSTGTGVFLDAMLEYVRLVMNPHEDEAIEKNGSAYATSEEV